MTSLTCHATILSSGKVTEITYLTGQKLLYNTTQRTATCVENKKKLRNTASNKNAKSRKPVSKATHLWDFTVQTDAHTYFFSSMTVVTRVLITKKSYTKMYGNYTKYCQNYHNNQLLITV